MDYRDKILVIARAAPVLPSAIAKELQTNSIMAGAMLSEMCDKGLLKTSSLRVGGSPLYFVPGNEAQLLNHVQSLNEKDRRTVSLLDEKKLLRESECDPLTRVSLAAIKDFAKPLVVSYDGKEERFWKWFALADSDAEKLIGQLLEPPKAKAPQEPKELVKEAPKEIVKEVKEQVPVREPIPIKEQAKLPDSEAAKAPVQKTLEPVKLDGDFAQKLLSFFAGSNILVKEQSVVKKKTEFDLVLDIPSPVGSLTYFCKARSKKRVSDGDVSAALVEGQLRRLPVLFVTDGELSKQAQVMLAKLTGITVKKV
ncbi:hypothetical protein HY489_04005 [Candidatus Woesearchaeota archaeon]|nr:hypothetical protein [Candidatus Woesearchaeota archaeon]